MRVTLNIEADSLAEISSILTGYATTAQNGHAKITEGTKPVTEEVKPEKAKKEVAKKPAEKEESAKPEEPKADATPEVKEETKKMTLEVVRAAVADKAKTHRTEIKALLTSFAAQNVTSLKEEKYSEFLEKLNNL